MYVDPGLPVALMAKWSLPQCNAVMHVEAVFQSRSKYMLVMTIIRRLEEIPPLKCSDALATVGSLQAD